MQKSEKIKKIKEVVIYLAVFIFLFVLEGVGFISYTKGMEKGIKEKTKIVNINFTDTYINEENQEATFPFLKKEMSDYIEKMCNELGLDPYLCVSILLKENPTFDPKAVHENSNGTFDMGLWQLNSAYVWSTFKTDYWKFDFDLDPMNWKQNTYIALCHIRYLFDTLKTVDDVIQAYNCGAYAVMSDKIPASTVVYLAAVKLNYQLIAKEG